MPLLLCVLENGGRKVFLVSLPPRSALTGLLRIAEDEIVKNPIAQKAAQSAVKSVMNDTLAKYSLSSTAEDDHETHENEDIESSLRPDDEDLNMTPEELQLIKKWSYMLRIGFAVCASLMIIAGLFTLASASLGEAFIALYVIFFGSLICCYEIALPGISKPIAQNFGFMYTKFGRALFLLFMAFLSYGLGLFGIIVMCLLIIGMGVNIYVMYICPKYSEWVRIQHFKNLTNK